MYFLSLIITKACVSLCLSPNHPVTQSDGFICHIHHKYDKMFARSTFPTRAASIP